MNEFLQATEVIDWKSPSILSLAAGLSGGADDDEAAARNCFLWVRDQVPHSSDSGISTVTCAASEVLAHRVGFCYAKSHLLAALLRARGIPAALCYQRLALGEEGAGFCLHGLVAVFLRRHGWYRIDPRGDKADVATDFTPPVERLAFQLRKPGECDIAGRFADALPCVVEALQRHRTAGEVALNLPDLAPSCERSKGSNP